MNGRSQWRLDDAAAHARMGELMLELRSTLLNAGADSPGNTSSAHEPLRAMHRAAATVDGFDRSAVDELTTTLESRLIEANGSAS
ncbi:hypothetical protein ACWPKO_29895 (plasmid) [Coraliomargarita sp. W4R53]